MPCLPRSLLAGQIELVPGERIVQAWRFPVWEPGVYPIVRFTVKAEGAGTRPVIDQDGEPDEPRADRVTCLSRAVRRAMRTSPVRCGS